MSKISTYQKPGKEKTSRYVFPVQKTYTITDYGAIFEVFLISRKLAKQSNMLYNYMTMNVGAAIKAYQVMLGATISFTQAIYTQ
jgi:hypothetical protein